MLRSLLLGSALALGTVSASAALLVDFGGTGTPTVSGGSAWTVGNVGGNIGSSTATSPAYTLGTNTNVQVKLDGFGSYNFGTNTLGAGANLNVRDRSGNLAGDFVGAGAAAADLYRDFVFANTIRVTVSGLNASSSYDVRLFTWDNANSGSMTQYVYDITAGGMGTLLNAQVNSLNGEEGIDSGAGSTSVPINSRDEASSFGTVTSSASGTLVFRINAVNQQGAIPAFSRTISQYNFTNPPNAFNGAENAKISGIEIIPEPSTYAAIAGALALGLVAYRRRR